MTPTQETILRMVKHSAAAIYKASGVRPSTVWRIKKGLAKPNSETLERINAAIDVLEGKG